jgi:hypothetical protein
VPAAADPLNGRVWVTRQRVYEDRIASAWPIHRFINPDARFKFVTAKGYASEPDKLRLDAYEGEYTHEREHCTCEVLLTHTGLDEPTLAAIGKIVHDIDLKGGKFGRKETTGIAHLMAGIAATNKDPQRLERWVLDAFHQHFRRKRA